MPEVGEVSFELEKRSIDFALNTSFVDAEQRWSLHYRRSVSAHLVRRVADRVGERCEQCHDAALDYTTQLSPARPPKLVVVQSDGSHLPIRAAEAWKEAKLAVVVDGQRWARRRRGSRGLISQPRYVGVLGEQSLFRGRLDTALRIERAGGAQQVVWLGDGAVGNWSLARTLAPRATEILDWHHALEHGSTCIKSMFGDDTPWLALWQERIAQQLLAGEVEELIEELGDCFDIASSSERKPLLDLIRYYRANKERMRYDSYLASGLPIGSGVVESAHKHVLQRRMKNAGQRWSYRRAQRMVRMRCAYQTAGADRFYSALRRAELLTRTNQIPRVGWVKRRASRAG